MFVAKPRRGKRLIALILALIMTVALLPPIKASAATYTFDSGAVVLDASYSGSDIYINNGVFSVTVVGATDINIIFDGVTIDRRFSSDTSTGGLDGYTIPSNYPSAGSTMYDAVQTLGWVSGTTTDALVCPFLITGNSTVTASFRGTCTFYAGTNNCVVYSNGEYDAAQAGGGYAGIQVDSGSTLTIAYAKDLTVYGAHQLAAPDANGQVGGMDYSDVLRANTTIAAAGYTDPWPTAPYRVPEGATNNRYSGGAGIGGGVAYNSGIAGTSAYTQGTPGTIIIESADKIEAFGGHQAAGIGGGVNGAATSGSIIINDGNVIAHGGRWSAGIGDGDSTPNEGGTYTSDSFGNASRIEINGGTVTSYGGVGSSGIGCSDGLDAVGITSGMQIAINGGTVNAFSGFPDKFSGAENEGKYPSEAPAAIGAGSKSNMESNSIYISSKATLSCAGFGNYSLTENGTNDEHVPVINVDSDGYLLLLRTAEYFSSGERVLQLWKPHKVTHPVTNAECFIYTNQDDGGTLYYLDREHSVWYDENMVELAEDDVPDHLTLYTDHDPSNLIDSIELAYFFRSIALTLPHPDEYGGIYILTVPVEGIPDGVDVPPDATHINLTVEATSQGTQSGQIDYPTQHNIGMDETAEKLTDLDAYYSSSDALPTNGLIGDEFYDGVYAYTVYVEADTEDIYLRAAFADNGKNYTITLDGKTLTKNDLGDTIQVSSTIDMSGVNEKTVRLKKIDDNKTLGAISYKITFVKKGEYKLELSDPSKVYDGQAVSVTAKSVYSGSLYSVQNVELTGSTSTGNAQYGQIFSVTGQYLRCHESDNRDRYKFNFSLTGRTVSSGQPDVIHYVFHLCDVSGGNRVNVINDAGYYVGWTVTYPEDGSTPTVQRLNSAPNEINLNGATWITDAASYKVAERTDGGTGAYLHFETGANAGTFALKISYNNSINQYPLVSATKATLNKTGGGNQTEAYEEAKAALNTAAPGTQFPYSVDATFAWTQPLSTQKLSGNSSGSAVNRNQSIPKYTKKANGYYEIVSSGGETTFYPATEDELNSAVITYYPQAVVDGVPQTDGEGNPVFSATPLAGPPTDAGTYRVDGRITSRTYNAQGSLIFTIEQRPVTVLQIENWLRYVTAEEAKTLAVQEVIPDPGEILLDNLVNEDVGQVSLSVSSGNVYYNDTTVTYSPHKITLKAAVLIGARAHNYKLVYNGTQPDEILVFGQIAYDMQGVIFRKTADGDWRKYYPVDATDPVDGTSADYHSPADGSGVYRAHAEYVKARVVNADNRDRYAVDIEYGAMQFTYFHNVWDVNQMAYVEAVDSHWIGFDGTTNKVVLHNYSSLQVWYRVEAEIDFFHAAAPGSSAGLTPKITLDYAGLHELGSETWTPVAAAAPGDSSNIGTSGYAEFYLFLSGVPQMQESAGYTPVGDIIVSLAASPPGG